MVPGCREIVISSSANGTPKGLLGRQARSRKGSHAGRRCRGGGHLACSSRESLGGRRSDEPLKHLVPQRITDPPLGTSETPTWYARCAATATSFLPRGSRYSVRSRGRWLRRSELVKSPCASSPDARGGQRLEGETWTR